MRMLPICVVLVIACLTHGCSYMLYVDGRPGPDQSIRFDGGMPVLESTRVNSVAVRPVYSNMNGKLMFYVVLANLTQSPFDLSLNNIWMTCSGSPVRVWQRDEIIKKIERDAAWQAFAVALGAAVDSYSASQPTRTYGSGTYSSYGYGGSSYGTFSGGFETYDPAASAAAQAAIRARASTQIQSIASAAAFQQASIRDIITRQTIFPGGYFGGLVLIDAPPGLGITPKILTITVNTPGDTHALNFGLTKR
jgi:hypothetical protein